MTIIKICGVRDIQTARFCGELGVDMIGLHAIHGLRPDRMRKYKRITSEMCAYYPETTPVLVTKVTDAEELTRMLLGTDTTWFQVHAFLDRRSAEKMLASVTRTLGHRPGYVATVAADDPFVISATQELREVADYILLDTSYRGGTGQRADPEVVRHVLEVAAPTATLVAGGLCPENVADVLRAFGPSGVDVESALEIHRPGRPKDPVRVMEFVRIANGAVSATLSPGFPVSAHRPAVSATLTRSSRSSTMRALERLRHTDHWSQVKVNGRVSNWPLTQSLA